jgi:hypothetical protein
MSAARMVGAQQIVLTFDRFLIATAKIRSAELVVRFAALRKVAVLV